MYVECLPHVAAVREKPLAISWYDITTLVLSPSAFQLPCADERDDAGLLLDMLTDSNEVDALRTLYGADLVHLITKQDIIYRDDPICGLA